MVAAMTLMDLLDDATESLDTAFGVQPVAILVAVKPFRSAPLAKLAEDKDAPFKSILLSPNNVISDRQLQIADVVVLEMRVAEAFEDLEVLKSIKRLKPLTPVIIVSSNDNLELKVMSLRCGAVDFQQSEVPYIELIGRIQSLCRVGRAVRLVEVQNKELISSMQALQVSEAERAKSQAIVVNTAKLASLGEMAGNVAHEINNPLTILDGRIEQLRRLFGAKGPLDKSGADLLLDGMATITRRIALIVKGLRSVSRSGTQDPFQIASLRDIVEETLAFCSAAIREKGIELKVPVISENLKIHCRFTQISQVLLNLLTNANDAVEGTNSPWIEVQVEELHDEVIIAVIDSGHGVPEEYIQKIYQPFFTTKPVNKGTGLGLSISRSIIEEHHGTLSIDKSCPNTKFMMRIPKKQA